MSDKKRVSILINSMSGGGAERIISIILPHLLKRYEVFLVLTTEDDFAYNLPKSLEIVYIAKQKPNSKGFIKLLALPVLAFRYAKFCKKKHIDISLSFLYRPTYVDVLSKLISGNHKVVVNERSTPSKAYSSNSLTSSVNKWLIKKLYPKADIIIANSFFAKKDLVQNFSIKEDRIKVIQNAIDIKNIEILSNEPIGDFDAVFEGVTYITLGRLTKDKNHKMLIQAFYDAKFTDARLLILGDGELKLELEKQIESLSLSESVKLLGFQKNPFAFMRYADCFVFASRFEGFPNVLLEAMACGLPVITTDCPGDAGYILGDFGCGKLVDVDDVENMKLAMMELYESAELRSLMGQNAKKRAQHFSIESMVESFIATIEENCR